MQDFLNNFHKRMEKLSYSFLIDNKVSTLTAYRDYFDNLELINLVYSLMCFVLDKSLKDEECRLSQMTSFLEEIVTKYYRAVINEEEAKEITRFIVYKILRNDGKPFIFRTFNYETSEQITFDFHLLQQKTSKVDNNKSTFSLTQEGYRLILGALEVDEKVQIDINQMILELSLKKKNFSQGLMAVENLNNLITAQINIIKNFIYKTRENIFSIEQKDFEEKFLKNIEVLNEQNKKFDELKEIIILEEERLNNSKVEFTKENYDSLRQLSKIKELLINITYKSSELITNHFQFKNEYKKALEEASFYYSNKRINIKEDLIKPIEKDASSLANIFKLFTPMFRVKAPKKFNINYMFNEQKLYLKDEEEDEVLIDLIEDDEREALERQRNRDEYKGIVASILSFLINRRNTDLKSMVEFYINQGDKEYGELVPTVRKISEVLVEFLRIGVIDVNQMVEEQNEAYDNEEIEFDFRKLLVDELLENYKAVPLNTISFYKSLEGEKITISEKPLREEEKEFITIETLKCPNIIMEVE